MCAGELEGPDVRLIHRLLGRPVPEPRRPRRCASHLVGRHEPRRRTGRDGGGQVNAARRPVHGADRVARFVPGITTKGTDEQICVVNVNGAPGIGLFRGSELSGVVSLTVGRGRISRIDFVRAPDKLRHTSN